jgi:glycosyltransferase involved in cell wall biosynthesis
MKIAIDVHSLGTRAAGNETYFQQLLAGLAGDQSDHEYALLYVHRAALEPFALDARFRLVEIPTNPLRRNVVAIPRALRAIRPDVFHCQYVVPPFVHVPTVVSIHDLAYEHFPEYFRPFERWRMKRQVRAAAQRAAHVVTLSEYSAGDMAEKYGISREKITVTHLAADARFQPRDRAAAQKQIAEKYGIAAPFVLYVGRVQARKNLPRLVEAFAQVRARSPELRLVIVGKRDWQAEQLLARVQGLGLQSAVTLTGYVAAEDLPPFYNAAEVFVFPSFFEGFGLPVLEAMASGTPTITSQGSSLEEVAGDAALLTDPHSTKALADALSRVLCDPELRRSLADRGLQRSREFQHQELARKLLRVYAQVGSRAAGQRA